MRDLRLSFRDKEIYNESIITHLNNGNLNLNSSLFGQISIKPLNIIEDVVENFYGPYIKGYPLIIECYIPQDTNKKILAKIIFKAKNKKGSKGNVEIDILKKFHNEIYINNISPCFPMYFKTLTDCSLKLNCFKILNLKNIIDDKDIEIQQKANILLCEYIKDKDISYWVKKYTEDNIKKKWKSVLFQIIYTLAILQDKYNFVHNDFHTNNILVDDSIEYNDNEYILFDYKGTKFYIPNKGFIIKLWDFEFSKLHKKEHNVINNIIKNKVYNPYKDLHYFISTLIIDYYSLLDEELINFIKGLYPQTLLDVEELKNKYNLLKESENKTENIRYDSNNSIYSIRTSIRTSKSSINNYISDNKYIEDGQLKNNNIKNYNIKFNMKTMEELLFSEKDGYFKEFLTVKENVIKTYKY